MKRVYTIKKFSFYPLVLSLLFVVFFITQPRVLSLNPFHYTQFRQQFLDELSQTKVIEPKQFWKFREFYSPGNFTFDSKIIRLGETQIIYNLPEAKNTLLTFTAPRLSSVDSIIKVSVDEALKPHLAPFLPPNLAQDTTGEVIFVDDTTLLLKAKDGKYHLFFVKTIQEMQTTNGFFDYTGSEKQLLEDTIWFNNTTFW